MMIIAKIGRFRLNTVSFAPILLPGQYIQFMLEMIRE